MDIYQAASAVIDPRGDNVFTGTPEEALAAVIALAADVHELHGPAAQRWLASRLINAQADRVADIAAAALLRLADPPARLTQADANEQLAYVGERFADVAARAEHVLAAGTDEDWRGRYADLARSVGFTAASFCGVKGSGFDRWYLGLADFEDSRGVVTREWTVGGLPGADFTGVAVDDVEGAKARAVEALDRRGYRLVRWETVADDTPWVFGPAGPDHYVAHVEPIEKG